MKAKCSKCGRTYEYDGKARGKTFVEAFLSFYYIICPECMEKENK